MTTIKKDLKPVVFDVDLTGPLETPKPPPEIQKPPVVKKKTLPPARKKLPFEIRKPKPLPEGVIPESLEGAGAHEQLKGDEKKDAPSQLQKENKGELSSKGPDLPEPSDKGDVKLPSGKDGVSIIPPSALFDRKTIQKYYRYLPREREKHHKM